MTRQRHSPDPTVTWPGDYLIPSMETKFNRKKNERGSSQRKEIGIIACKKCTLKTTKLHWSHFERDQWENIIMGNQIVPGIYATTVPISCYFLFEFPCNPLARNVILSFLWWNRCESVLPVRDGKLMRCMFGQRSTVLAFPNKMASKRRPCGAESTAKMIFQNHFLNHFFV